MIAKLKTMLGLDIKEKEYAYDIDPEIGYLSEKKIPDKWVKTTCGYCSVGCGMIAGVKDNKIISVRGDYDHPVNQGNLCPKGLSEHEPLTSPNRAITPLIKDENGNHKPISWDGAYEHMTRKVAELQYKYGNDCFSVLSTGQLLTEEFYTLGKLVQLGFGTNNYDGNTTLCMSSAVVGYKQSFGSDGPPGSYKGLEEADCIFLIGANIADNHPILWNHVYKNKNLNLIVCDPRKTKTAMLAKTYLPIKPRSDIDLLNGLIHLVIRHNYVDKAYVENHTEGFDQLAQHAEKYTPSFVSEKTGLPVELIMETFESIVNSKNTFFAWTMGVNHSTQGSDTVSLINTLALITGNIGRTGAAPMSITGQCNAMGSREFSFSSSLPAYRKFENEQDRLDLANFWNIDPNIMPTKRGYNYPQIIDAILEGKLKALWVIATNPIVSFPDQNRLKEAFSKLDLLVVQDAFHPTPTGEIADLILPAATWGEKQGSYTNSERRVSVANKAIDPPGLAKSDFEIFQDLSLWLGKKEMLYPGWTSTDDAFEEMRKISKGRLCDYSGITKEKKANGGVQWPCNDKYPDGCDSLYSDGIFQTESGKAKLLFTESEPLPESTSNSFRLILNTGRTVEHWHTRTKTGNVELLNKLSPEAWVEVNPRTAKHNGIRQQDKVSLISPRGRIDDILVRITETIHPDHVFMPFHFAEKCINKLTFPAFDPKSGEPNYKQCAVRIERYDPPS